MRIISNLSAWRSIQKPGRARSFFGLAPRTIKAHVNVSGAVHFFLRGLENDGETVTDEYVYLGTVNGGLETFQFTLEGNAFLEAVWSGEREVWIHDDSEPLDQEGDPDSYTRFEKRGMTALTEYDLAVHRVQVVHRLEQMQETENTNAQLRSLERYVQSLEAKLDARREPTLETTEVSTDNNPGEQGGEQGGAAD